MTVRLEIDGPTATIVIDNPDRRNAMTVAMWESVPARLTMLRPRD